MRGRYPNNRRGGGCGLGDRETGNQHRSHQGGSGEMATTGTVKWFSPKKGYGFITMEDGQEVFVHYSAIDGNGFRSLEQGERVQFEVSQGPKGLQAANVMRA
jgi:CspA family cold shock protein